VPALVPVCSKFPFKNGANGQYVYIIQLDRDLLKDRLDAGNFQTTLSDINDETNVITLIDNSNDLTNSKYILLISRQ
jgi:hypothetical protein